MIPYITGLFELIGYFFTFPKDFGADGSEMLLFWFLLTVGSVCIYFVRKNTLSIYWAIFISCECLIVSTSVWYYLHTIEPFPKDTCGIYIARFQGDNGTEYRDEIFESLKRAVYDASLTKKVKLEKLPCRIWGRRGNDKARYWGKKGNAKMVIWGRFPSDVKIWSWITVVNPGLVGGEPLMMGPTSGIVLQRKLSEVAVPEELVKRPLLLTNVVLAYALSEDGKYNKAIKSLENVIQKDPNFFGGYFYLGNAYYKMWDFDSSVEMFKRAIEIKPDYLDAYIYLGVSYYSKKSFKESIETFKKAKEINPYSASVYHNMGVTYYAMKRFRDSVMAYTKAAQLRPRDLNTRNGLTSACVALGQPDRAIEIWREIVHRSPDYSFYLVLGVNCNSVGRLDQAEQFLKKSLELRSDYALIYSFMGKVFIKQGRLKDGLEMYLKCKEKDPDRAVGIFKECRKLIHSDERVAKKLREQILSLKGELKELAEKFLSERTCN